MMRVELADKEFASFQKYIYETAGIRLGDHKKTLVGNRLRRRLAATGSSTYSDYYRFLTSAAGKNELPNFLDEVTTNETYFFRDEHQYEWFEKTFLPEVIDEGQKGKRPKSLKVWSAASSTGEEPYSIAMCLRQRLAVPDGWIFRIFGTDLSEGALQKAGKAVYGDRSLQLVSQSQRRRFFKQSKGESNGEPTWALTDDVKELVTYQCHNLLKPMTRGPFDCIFIKNVLIYFDEASKRAVVEHLMKALSRGGYLVVGPSEGIFRMLDSLEKIKPWLYRKSR